MRDTPVPALIVTAALCGIAGTVVAGVCAVGWFYNAVKGATKRSAQQFTLHGEPSLVAFLNSPPTSTTGVPR